jgi:hypothetical protein
VTVAGVKGGVGKTVTAVHLAAFLSGKDATLLVEGTRSLCWDLRKTFLPPSLALYSWDPSFWARLP